MLSEQMEENVLWLNKQVAEKMKIADGEVVEVASNGNCGTIKAKLTDFIHPEAVFMVHGFGHVLPVESRALGKGILDNCFMPGGLDTWDRAGEAAWPCRSISSRCVRSARASRVKAERAESLSEKCPFER